MRMFRISCKCPKKKERRGGSNWLGSLDLDVPGIAVHHCKVCNTTWEHRVDENGMVYRREVKGTINHVGDIAVVDMG